MTLRYRDTVFYNSAGVIIRSQDRFLCVKQTKNGVWSFPKGGPEPRDNTEPFNTAIREVFEETGLQIDTDYTLTHKKAVKYPRRARYYFAILKNGSEPKIVTNPKEVQEFGWFRVEEMRNLYPVNCGIRYFLKGQ